MLRLIRFAALACLGMCAFGLWMATAHGQSSAAWTPSQVSPPPIIREFRGVWIATVKNIDWPSRRGLPVDRQKSELTGLFDRARSLGFNAVILQVRTSCDAFYPSALEPWSEYLTGKMGVGPQPNYDPLAFAIEEAHRRGLELHAWFNPYRARHGAAASPIASNHISRTQPGLVRRYKDSLWLDPGDPRVEEHVLRVILDVVRRYDIDGVHLDDYFYPYPEKTVGGGILPFPDESTYARYRQSGGQLDLAAWRRHNVDRLIHRLSVEIKRQKSWVKYGISPFGIWKSGNPASVKGLSAAEVTYADARKWFQEGWVDYLAPQLYWSTQSKEQKFQDLLRWWIQQNRKSRPLWPGISLVEPATGTPRAAVEILEQMRWLRREHGSSGAIFWSAHSLGTGSASLGAHLSHRAFQQPALPPAMPWIEAVPPPAPKLHDAETGHAKGVLQWDNPGPEPVRWWVMQTRKDGRWTTRIFPGSARSYQFDQGPGPEVVAITAVDRTGNAGPPLVLQRTSGRGH